MRHALFGPVALCGMYLVVSGCGPSIIGNVDVAVPPAELTQIAAEAEGNTACLVSVDPQYLACRNNYIAMKMFLIDRNYAAYKILLTQDDSFGSLGIDLTQIGLAAVGGVIPVSQTTKILSASSAAVGLANAAVNKDLLYTQTIQAIEQQMDTQRASVKQTILSRMSCPATTYPAGLVLSDLQAYADAGTVTSALNGIAKTTANAQPAQNGTKGTASPVVTSTTPGANAIVQATNSGATATLITTTPPAPCPLS
ncbi:MAG: hypothetical protein AB1508_13305 [Pseudomonadota bacterium]